MIYNLGLNRGTVNSKKVLNRPVQEYKMIVKIQEGTMIQESTMTQPITRKSTESKQKSMNVFISPSLMEKSKLSKKKSIMKNMVSENESKENESSVDKKFFKKYNKVYPQSSSTKILQGKVDSPVSMESHLHSNKLLISSKTIPTIPAEKNQKRVVKPAFMNTFPSKVTQSNPIDVGYEQEPVSKYKATIDKGSMQQIEYLKLQNASSTTIDLKIANRQKQEAIMGSRERSTGERIVDKRKEKSKKFDDMEIFDYQNIFSAEFELGKNQQLDLEEQLTNSLINKSQKSVPTDNRTSADIVKDENGIINTLEKNKTKKMLRIDDSDEEDEEQLDQEQRDQQDERKLTNDYDYDEDEWQLDKQESFQNQSEGQPDRKQIQVALKLQKIAQIFKKGEFPVIDEVSVSESNDTSRVIVNSLSPLRKVIQERFKTNSEQKTLADQTPTELKLIQPFDKQVIQIAEEYEQMLPDPEISPLSSSVKK